MCRYALLCCVDPPRIGLRFAAGGFTRFIRDTRGAVTLDWMTLSAGLAGLAALVVAGISWFGILDGEAIAARVQADARQHVVAATGIERVDPGAQYAPGAPVFDPGGKDPGAVGAPAPLPASPPVPDADRPGLSTKAPSPHGI